MKHVKMICILTICLAVGISAAIPEKGLKPGTKYFQVTPSVVMAKHEYGSNITCIATTKGLYFVDCGMSTELLKRFREDMEKKYGKKARALLITHAHIDHYLGMAAFKDVEVVAAESGRPLWQRQLAIKFNEQQIKVYTGIFPKFAEAVKTAKPFLPTVWFQGSEVLGEGNDQLIFTNTGGHSADSSSIYFPKEGVLVTGDLVQVDQWPYFGDPTTDMKAWLAAFNKWETLPVKKVCAGHGGVADLSYVKLMRTYFEKMIATLKVLKKQKLAIQEVVKHKDLPARYWKDSKPQPRWWNYCIASLYQKL
jgi:glyoxylase-like metal-dependent hydrolase (beta-lactamase superfamily II)